MDTSSWRSPVSWLADTAVSAAVVLVFWIPSVLAPGGNQWLGVCLAALVSCAMLLRWKAPSAAVSVALVSTAAGWLVSATTDPMLGVAWCLYPLALKRRAQSRGAGSVVVGVLVLVTLVLGVSGSTQDLMQRVAFSFGAIGAAWLLGHIQAERLSAVRRAERQQVEFEHVQREAVMAREVHDIVGHALSTIRAEAGIARAVSSSDKAEMLEALEDIENRSRDALEQVQSLVRAMRRRDYSRIGDSSGQSPVAALRELVAAATVSGLEVDAHIDLPECGRDVTFVVTRVVQEALSNIIRHAAAERCELMVAPVEEKLVVQVNDDGKGILADEDAGSGISGMRERVESVGGRLTVANRLGRGTSVVAELPLAVRD
ncbi:sensor histidine kinase [Nocardiopsis synnemataformans]|uniref:sensor histidine kinase n=1 Tax=Nocardiopsis synnemataformans TaxID=61305 RepID=UPI003EBF917A